MKFFTAILIVLVTFSVSKAQEFSKMSLVLKPEQKKVILKMEYANLVHVESWEKNEVLVQAEVNINNGKQNHAHRMNNVVDNHVVTIIADLDKEILSSSHTDDCSESDASYFNFDDSKQGEQHRLCSNILYTVHLPADMELKVETITGEVMIANMQSAIEVRSITGAIELTIPSNHPADVHLKSVMGNVSSDPEISLPNEKMKRLISRELNGQLNGGGKSVHLESVIGNVTLRSPNN